jgi:hypothetical protein
MILLVLLGAATFAWAQDDENADAAEWGELLDADAPTVEVPDEPVDRERMQKLAEQVAANARRWVEDRPLDPNVDARLDKVVYDAQSVRYLRMVTSRPRPDPIDLYVVNKLLEPLMRADAEVIESARPMINSLQSRYGRYMRAPRYSPGQLRKYDYGDYRQGAAERLLRKIGQIEEARDEKEQAERVIERHNHLVGRILRKAYELMAVQDDRSMQKRLMQLIVQTEARGDATCVQVMEAIAGAADRMPKAQAERFYGDLTKLLEAWRLKGGEYLMPWSFRIVREDESYFEKMRGVYWGIVIPETMNALATVAEKPQVRVPDREKMKDLVEQARRKKQ